MVGTLVHLDDAPKILTVAGMHRNGFTLMGRVSVEIELQEPDTTEHREINSFFDGMKGKRVRLTITEAV